MHLLQQSIMQNIQASMDLFVEEDLITQAQADDTISRIVGHTES